MKSESCKEDKKNSHSEKNEKVIERAKKIRRILIVEKREKVQRMEEYMGYAENKKEMYEEVALQLQGLFEDCTHFIANLANASAVLNQAMREINWVGFYLCEKESKVTEEAQENKEEILILGPFQGKPACVEIRYGRGVCGTALAKDEVMLVKNVHEFPGHIACDGASNSEIVLPIHVAGKVIGVLDIDSPLLARFDEEDQEGLEKVVKVIEEMINACE